MDLLELCMHLERDTCFGIIVNGEMIGVFGKCPEEYEESLIDMIVPVGWKQLNVYVKE